MRVYIAGPMTGLPGFNYPAFGAAAEMLRGAGHCVVNPAELHDGDTGRDYAHYLRAGLRALLECDAVVMLPGWELSKGATLERRVAEAIGLRILTVV